MRSACECLLRMRSSSLPDWLLGHQFGGGEVTDWGNRQLRGANRDDIIASVGVIQRIGARILERLESLLQAGILVGCEAGI